MPAQTVRVPSQGVEVVDVATRVPLDSDFAVVATARRSTGRRVPIVAELLATWAPASSTTGLAGTLGSTLTATRWVVPVPDVDAAVTVTVFNPGPDPVTAEVLAAGDVDRRVGPTSEPSSRSRPARRRRSASWDSGAAQSRASSPRTIPWWSDTPCSATRARR